MAKINHVSVSANPFHHSQSTAYYYLQLIFPHLNSSPPISIFILKSIRMKVSLPSLFALAMLTLLACQQTDLFQDTELIQAIESATDKTTITVSELPSEAKTALDQAYVESIAEAVMKAEGLGYEVNTRFILGEHVGADVPLYFDLEGRELQRRDRRMDRYRDTDRNRTSDRQRVCFDYIFPLSYTMPDGTTLTAIDRTALGTAMRSWYAANPTANTRPSLQFPVGIRFRDGRTERIADFASLRRAYASCD